jgi:predicted transposase/invertase (TIGR01784 family)
MIGIIPTVDFACKSIIGSPDHPAITLHFLNAILRGDPFIRDVKILNPIIEREFDEDKLSILDVLASDSYGRRFNIEIQRSVPAGLPQRLTYYGATQLTEQLGEGDSYVDLRPAIGICILDAILFRQVADFHLDFRLMNQKNDLLFTDCLQIHLLELPKYVPPTDNRVITDPIEQWAFFFRRASELTPTQLTARLPGPVFREATGILEMIARDPHQRSLYNRRLKMEMDERARLEAAVAEGLAEGTIIGRIQLLQSLMGIAETPTEILREQPLTQLAELNTELQRQFQDRRRD